MTPKPLLFGLILSLIASPAGAVTFNFAGTVNTGVGSIGAGTALTGTLTYDENTAPLPGGSAFQEVYEAVTSFSYTLGSLSGSFSAPLGGAEIQIDNDLAGQSDRFGHVSRVADGLTAATLDGTFDLVTFSFRLDDPTFAALSSTALPSSLALGDFPSNAFFVFLTDQSGNPVTIDGTLSSLTAVNQIPVPAALPLFMGAISLLGLLGWRRRRNASAA